MNYELNGGAKVRFFLLFVINSTIIGKVLYSGEYVDTTGVAKVNFSPEPPPASATTNC